ncbi:bifunctional diaminohydroxyphosphoribosylaminopyrimidine deaminase/5-amino-6-(5-phosphoribosylamino)uracil reductase RibD [Halosquirtibacter xylanolyticus]|uniref:bifunctional diaminohydroxyphosphoribosylaminopyrimidine deaminase/5-amino-6-(5-phosphoribosylamino)uracil reductase RibD n=1 Tax=Halosquirtibacter xylanolyticus TaxID=3374599 RepID=UPI003749EFDA|nr:bifunctional diaminohydroxyphosphoribosylaminopyrimidine deaminase/5-amino-6-(5-phosphoribosylamino)uracil reductase RibD [Prolixibacteraceae bacterium]
MNYPFDVASKYMMRAIEIARLGMSRVAPNPMVGAVVVHQDKIIGEGFHQVYGGPHAEVNAIAAVKNRELLSDSTIYVTLEPCAHYGKTPPCAELIIKSQMPRVVVGIKDPFAKVKGRGIQMMKEAGVEVIESFLEDRCYELNRRFFTFHQYKRPYIILKWAQTLDGYMDIDRTQENYGQPTWITNELSKVAVHKTRIDEDAIMVGTQTAVKDNPSLTVREWTKGRDPLRVLLDLNARVPKEQKLFDGSIPTVIYTFVETPPVNNTEFVVLDKDLPLWSQLLEDLHRRDIQSLIVEGGPATLKSLIDQELWDEARVFLGHGFFQSGVKAPGFPGKMISRDYLDNSSLIVFRREEIKPL